MLLPEIMFLCNKHYFQYFYFTTQRYLPVYLATPLKLISSIIIGSERPLALTAKMIIRYVAKGSKLSIKNVTGLVVCWKQIKKRHKNTVKNSIIKFLLRLLKLENLFIYILWLPTKGAKKTQLNNLCQRKKGDTFFARHD